MFRIEKYTSAHQNEWNEFVSASRNGTFLHNRQYMEYHADRFQDYSLLFYKEEKLYALLPANLNGDTICSHGGLTYGGLITGIKATAEDILQAFRDLNNYLKCKGIKKVIYKPVPAVFQNQLAQEDLYALFAVCHASLRERNLSSTIVRSNPINWRRDRKYNANKAMREGITIEEASDFAPFWRILEDNLMATHHARPVHTIEEITLLHSRFPKNIRLFTASRNGVLLGGTVLYVTQQTIHTQYISASPEGKRLHAIDLLFRQIFGMEFNEQRYFDFGTSNEQHGEILNTSLISQKEGFGGRGTCFDIYEWTL